MNKQEVSKLLKVLENQSCKNFSELIKERDNFSIPENEEINEIEEISIDNNVKGQINNEKLHLKKINNFIENSEIEVKKNSEEKFQNEVDKKPKNIFEGISEKNIKNEDYLSNSLKIITKEEEDWNKKFNSIFEQEPFYNFTNKHFKSMFKKKNIKALIEMREKALEIRHEAEHNLLNNLLDKNSVTTKLFDAKKKQLEKWVNKEKENIQKTKIEIEKGWLGAVEALKKVRFFFILYKIWFMKKKQSLIMFCFFFFEFLNFFFFF